MEFLPRTMGTRPRVALEVRPEGLVAARAEGSPGTLAAVAWGDLREGALRPGLRTGNVVDRPSLSAAVRRTLEGVATRSAERSKYITLIVPDASARVLLLDFDALPNKAAEALAVVRFRLKKLLPFDAEHAVVTYQVMSSGRDGVRVLAVAMPCDVLAEYEGFVADAGYLPGAVLPSTLSALAGLDAGEAGSGPVLVVNAGPASVTTAIVQGGVLLLHRTVDLRVEPGLSDRAGGAVAPSPQLDKEAPGARWSSGEGSDYDRMDAETEMQSEVLRGQRTPPTQLPPDQAVREVNAVDPASVGREITQAVSVAVAYFEDTLGGSPQAVLAAGTMGAERLQTVLDVYGFEGLRVREMIDPAAIGSGASLSKIPLGWLAGVRGAVKS